MSQDIGFFLPFNDDGLTIQCADLVIENGDVKADDGLETAVLISLFTDRFVDVENLPDDETDPQGWWADLVAEVEGDQIGSTIWTVYRGKILENTVSRFEDAARDALQWLVDDGVAETVTVEGTRVDAERVDLAIEITRPRGINPVFKFIWDGQELRREAA